MRASYAPKQEQITILRDRFERASAAVFLGFRGLSVAKATELRNEFRKDDVVAQKLTVKCGVLESQILSSERVENELATLPSKDELRAMLLATLLAPAQALVMQLMAPGQNLAFALDARKRQLEEGNG